MDVYLVPPRLPTDTLVFTPPPPPPCHCQCHGGGFGFRLHSLHTPFAWLGRDDVADPILSVTMAIPYGWGSPCASHLSRGGSVWRPCGEHLPWGLSCFPNVPLFTASAVAFSTRGRAARCCHYAPSPFGLLVPYAPPPFWGTPPPLAYHLPDIYIKFNFFFPFLGYVYFRQDNALPPFSFKLLCSSSLAWKTRNITRESFYVPPCSSQIIITKVCVLDYAP